MTSTPTPAAFPAQMDLSEGERLFIVTILRAMAQSTRVDQVWDGAERLTCADAADAIEALIERVKQMRETSKADRYNLGESEKETERAYEFAKMAASREAAAARERDVLREALEKIDGEGPPKEPRNTWASTDPDDAFEEGAVRGRWELAQIALAALGASK